MEEREREREREREAERGGQQRRLGRRRREAEEGVTAKECRRSDEEGTLKEPWEHPYKEALAENPY